MPSEGKTKGIYNIDLQCAVQHLRDQKIISKDKEIADKMEVGQGTVSNYVNGMSKASANFRKSFEKAFGISLLDFQPPAGEGTKKPGSFDYQADLKDAMATIRSYNDFLQRMLESSLGKVLRDQEGNSGIIVELLKRDVRREADGNPEKEKEILDEIVHRIGPKLGSDLKEGIAADGSR